MLATTARARVGARGGARVRYAGPVADGNNGMRPARRAVTERYARMPSAVTNRSSYCKRGDDVTYPDFTFDCTIVPDFTFYGSGFHGFFFARKEKARTRSTCGAHSNTRMRIAQHSTCINLVLLVMFSDGYLVDAVVHTVNASKS